MPIPRRARNWRFLRAKSPRFTFDWPERADKSGVRGVFAKRPRRKSGWVRRGDGRACRQAGIERRKTCRPWVSFCKNIEKTRVIWVRMANKWKCGSKFAVRGSTIGRIHPVGSGGGGYHEAKRADGSRKNPAKCLFQGSGRLFLATRGFPTPNRDFPSEMRGCPKRRPPPKNPKAAFR